MGTLIPCTKKGIAYQIPEHWITIFFFKAWKLLQLTYDDQKYLLTIFTEREWISADI